MPAKRRNRSAKSAASRPVEQPLRIVGGRYRGRKLLYHGEPRTRPMKDRVREAVFNLLGPAVADKHVIDLFAGTGALGLEAISRGAAGATFVERHFPTARLIQQNIEALDVGQPCEVVTGDTFLWVRGAVSLPAGAWIVLCSPPYDFYITRRDELLDLLKWFTQRAPSGSLIVVEADKRFDFDQLPQAERWDVRAYPPAIVGILAIE